MDGGAGLIRQSRHDGGRLRVSKTMWLFKKKSDHAFKWERWHKVAVALLVYDALAANASYFFALWFRFDGTFSLIPAPLLQAWYRFTLIYTVITLAVFWCFRLYKTVWKYAGASESVRIFVCMLLLGIIHAELISRYFHRMPLAYYITGAVFQFFSTAAIRFSYRVYLLLWEHSRILTGMPKTSRVMLIGAGDAGQMILRDLHRTQRIQEEVCCIIDDDPNKWNRYIENVPIVGGREQIISAVAKYNIEKIYIAIPSAPASVKRDVLALCNQTGCKLKQLPGMYQLVSDQVTVTQLRDVAVEDLLGRDPVRSDLTEVFSFIQGKTVLVTGGGGSIGSELCRQIAAHDPGRLIIFDIYENNAYAIQLELREAFPGLRLETLIGSVRDSDKVFDVFAEYRPQIVYHAAAHKHVPLMEDSPCEAIKNNVIGTYKCAQAALDFGTRRFVLISTDKAVNPTNIMGASKRLCEMVVQMMDRRADAMGKDTDYVAVRFGNVLGSNGSVVPLFKKQIAEGGPVTVTHPDITRFFMTIPEAVSLVLQSAFYAYGGEIFVLDMGEPVKIDDMARKLIRLAGFEPDVDIKIVYTGLRPGEKLYEERLMDEEGLKKTANDMISIAEPIPMDDAAFEGQLLRLDELSRAESPRIREVVSEIVPTYHPERGAQAA